VTTSAVRIVQLSPGALAALAEGDLASADALSPVPLTPWLVSPEAIGTWRRRAVQVEDVPEDLAWVTGVLWSETERAVVGKAGFHAAPGEDGIVEVGYAVDPEYRRRGYARAALLAMVERARAHSTVRTLRATVSPHNAASLALIRELPFVEVGEQWDDEDGLETIYELDVS